MGACFLEAADLRGVNTATVAHFTLLKCRVGKTGDKMGCLEHELGRAVPVCGSPRAQFLHQLQEPEHYPNWIVFLSICSMCLSASYGQDGALCVPRCTVGCPHARRRHPGDTYRGWAGRGMEQGGAEEPSEGGRYALWLVGRVSSGGSLPLCFHPLFQPGRPITAQ